MSTGNAPPSNNGARLPNSQEQPLEWKQFTDIGLCVLVCDKVKDLLECMLAHALLEMSDEEVELLVNRLPRRMTSNARIQLSRIRNKTDLGGNQKGDLKEYIRKTMCLSPPELQRVVDALGEEQGRLVRKLRETRNNLVHKDLKFKNNSERGKFLATYYEFIDKFDFQKYFGSSHAEIKKKEYLQLSLEHKEFMEMLSEYNEIENILKGKIAQWGERYNKLKKRLETLEKERGELKGQVETLEKQLEEEKAKIIPLEQDRDDKQQQLSDKDREINRLNQQLAEVTQKLNKTEEERQLERDASREKDEKIRMLEEEKEMDKRRYEADYTALYKDKEEAEHGQSLLQEDLSEAEDSFTELTRQLVNIEREKVRLQNYFDRQTGGRAELSGSGLQFR